MKKSFPSFVVVVVKLRVSSRELCLNAPKITEILVVCNVKCFRYIMSRSNS